MNKYSRNSNLNSKKESIALVILFAIVGIIWMVFKGQYLKDFSGGIGEYNNINFSLDSIYIIITSIAIYIVAYGRIEKTRIINNELMDNLQEIAAVHEEKQSCEISLKNQTFMTESFIREIDLGVISWDENLNITNVNPYFLKTTKYEEKELIMRNAIEIFAEGNEIDHGSKTLQEIVNTIKSRDNIMRVKDKFGEVLEFSTYHMIEEDLNQEAIGVVTFAIDITERNKLEKKLRHLAYYDDLTGLPNKHHLRTYLLGRVLDEESKIGVLFIEVDDYKLRNESLGYKETEILLKRISNFLYVELEENDYLARVSENEFIIILDKIKGKEEIEVKARNILKEILKPISIDESRIHISAKIGASIYPDISNSLENLINEAYLALHHIRYNSEYNCIFYNKEMGERINNENFIINELEKAIENKDFILYFQPISYIKDNKIIGLETLIRWNHPEEGFISPAKFIPISEDTGQIYRITDIILEKALAQKQVWNEMGFKDFKLSVNISSKSFEKENLELELKILNLLAKYDIEPRELILEITETAAINDKNTDKVLKTFNRFRGIGIEIALDDFGTGSSSLSRLYELPIKYIKLDGAFVKNIGVNKEEQAIVKTVIELAHTLDLLVIAEGIETLEQGEALMSIGCSVGQGYYLARPAPAEEIQKIF